MGYNISYNPELNKRFPPFTKALKKRYKTIVLALVLVFAIVVFKNNEQVRHWLLPGNPVQTEQALNMLSHDIQNGVAVTDAIETFCRYIIDNAEFNQ